MVISSDSQVNISWVEKICQEALSLGSRYARLRIQPLKYCWRLENLIFHVKCSFGEGGFSYLRIRSESIVKLWQRSTYLRTFSYFFVEVKKITLWNWNWYYHVIFHVFRIVCWWMFSLFSLPWSRYDLQLPDLFLFIVVRYSNVLSRCVDAQLLASWCEFLFCFFPAHPQLSGIIVEHFACCQVPSEAILINVRNARKHFEKLERDSGQTRPLAAFPR